MKEEQPPVIQQPIIEQPVIEKRDTSGIKTEEKKGNPVVSEKPAKPEPTISLQEDIFCKKSQVLRAQRRISSKLKVQVEIVEQWDFYRVIIPGFSTSEETYNYYPELAGLGYPGAAIIEKK